MSVEKILLVFLGIVFTINFVLAVPVLTINSPTNITYDVNKILINVSSSEVVDFYMVGSRGKVKDIIAENTSSFENFLYVKQGSFNLNIFANNSNGEAITNVTFSTTAQNPINVTSCGILWSSNTAYVLGQDLSSTNPYCIQLREMRNSTFDLMGHAIDVNPRFYALSIWYSSDISLFNGTIRVPHSGNPSLWGALLLYGTKLTIENLTIEGSTGISMDSVKSSVIRNVFINSSVGIASFDAYDLSFVNSSINWNGHPTPAGSWMRPAAFVDASSTHSKIILEESNITGFPDYNFYLQGSFSDFYTRNTKVDLSKAFYPDWVADVRFFTQHLILIDASDQFNETGSGVIEIRDNDLFGNGNEGNLNTLENPTDNFLIGTDSDGNAQVWLTEKLTYAKSSSPPVINEYYFSNYNLTARTWDTNITNQLNLTGRNSTIPISFKLTVPESESLPQCTISQMLDLNNDGNVDILDATIILREIAGLTNSEQTESKSCEGINLNPF